jgi:hypothetical protein
VKIALATPLYPPDIAPAALYIKELAHRLATEGHAVTVITYGHLPEQVPGVRIVCTSNRRPLPIRILAYAWLLLRTLPGSDIIYMENGTSAELPALLASWILRIPYVMHLGDPVARERASKSRIRGKIQEWTMARAAQVLADSPLPRPEILPLVPYPTAAFDAYESSWATHLAQLSELFSTYATER